MDARASAGIERLNGLLHWWGASGGPSPELDRLVSLVADVQKAYLSAVEQHLELIFAANDRLGKLARAALDLQKPPEFLRAQSEIVAAMTRVATDYAENWTQLSAEVQKLCREIAVQRDGSLASVPQNPSQPASESTDRTATQQVAA